MQRHDIAVIGSGLSGMTAASILQRHGFDTVVLEAHATVGGCAGYYRRRGFSFDVGATTLVDFEPEGVGGRLLRELDLDIELEALPGYVAWLPDQTITLHRDPGAWHDERLRLGASAGHHRFWKIIDGIAASFWSISRRGGRLPIRSMVDVRRAIDAVRWRDLPHMRYLNWTAMDLLRHCRLEHDHAICGLLGMIVEDTVHAPLDRAPLVHAALGATMRGAGLCRARGGMRGFWTAFLARYEALGGHLCRNHHVSRIAHHDDGFLMQTSRGIVLSRQVICALPIEATAAIGPPSVCDALAGYVQRDRDARGGAIAMFLGVPEQEVGGQCMSHHQLLHAYDAPLGNGNNMFISVSSPGDTDSAPAGFRSVMISTHCELHDWEGLADQEYAQRKQHISDRLLAYARRVYPDLGSAARVMEVGTPRTYQQFTHRPRGAVGGVRLDPSRAGQRAVPQWIGEHGFYLAGDTTWPGVGTVACVISGRAAAELAIAHGDAPSRKRRGDMFASLSSRKILSNQSLTAALAALS